MVGDRLSRHSWQGAAAASIAGSVLWRAGTPRLSPLGHVLLPCAILLATTLLTTAGCSGFARRWQRNDVISARQIARQGIDAFHAGDWERAEEFFGQAVEVCPADERVRSRYAETLWQRGARKEAIEHMQEAVRLSGGEPDLAVRLGEMYLQQGDVHQANRWAQQVIRSGRESAAGHRLRGDVLWQQGNWREALATYHRALSIQPQYPEVQMAVAEVYHRNGRPQRALSTLQSLADTYPPGEEPAELLQWQGLALASLGRHAQAVEYLTRAHSQGLESAELLFSLAEAQHALGDSAAARAALERALQVDPGHPLATRLRDAIEGGRQVASLRN